MILAAAKLGATRLIDNLEVRLLIGPARLTQSAASR